MGPEGTRRDASVRTVPGINPVRETYPRQGWRGRGALPRPRQVKTRGGAPDRSRITVAEKGARRRPEPTGPTCRMPVQTGKTGGPLGSGSAFTNKWSGRRGAAVVTPPSEGFAVTRPTSCNLVAPAARGRPAPGSRTRFGVSSPDGPTAGGGGFVLLEPRIIHLSKSRPPRTDPSYGRSHLGGHDPDPRGLPRGSGSNRPRALSRPGSVSLNSLKRGGRRPTRRVAAAVPGA